MQGATHFIEIYKWRGYTCDTGLQPIVNLKELIGESKVKEFKTIAIFYIKPKL